MTMKKWNAEQTEEFVNYTTNRGVVSKMPSLWVPKSVYKQMASKSFTGSYKIAFGGKTKGNVASIERYAKSLPCEVVVHMQQSRKGIAVKNYVMLADAGICTDGMLGIVLSGVAKSKGVAS